MTKQTIFVIGNAGRNPEAFQTKTGQTAVSFPLAANRNWTDKKTGEKQEATQWFRVTAWNGRGESVLKHVQTGSQVLVLGRVSSSAWINAEGEPRSTVELTADQVVLLDKGGSHLETWIVGRLGGDPELRWTKSGTPVASFSLAASRGWFDDNGQWQEVTDWLKVTAWRKLGELASEYLRKGRLVFIRGHVGAEAWTGKDGQPQCGLTLTAREIKFLRDGNGNGRKTEPGSVVYEDEQAGF